MRSITSKLFSCLFIFGSLVLAQTPTITPGGVVSAAGLGGSTSIAPGSLISIFGLAGFVPVNLIFPVIVAPPCAAEGCSVQAPRASANPARPATAINPSFRILPPR